MITRNKKNKTKEVFEKVLLRFFLKLKCMSILSAIQTAFLSSIFSILFEKINDLEGLEGSQIENLPLFLWTSALVLGQKFGR